MKIDIPNNVSFILNKLSINNYKAYICGGCVRDSLLGRTPSDWDVCTSATPDEIIRVFRNYKTIPTGLKHGTVTVIIGDNHFEITTFRLDGDYSDGRRPDKVDFTNNIIKDLSRRDFTINAMAYNVKDGLIDPFGGIRSLVDLKEIRCVGDPDIRLQEDGLRILRAVRFSSQLGFKISARTVSSIIRNKEFLKKISKERIREELNKILLSEIPSKGIKLLHRLELLDYVIPELSKCVGFEQHNPNHTKDVFYHTLNVVDCTQPKLKLRLAALFHDIGKPNTFTMGEDGVGHFYEHHKESARICRKAMTRLKYSNKEIEYVSELVYHHMIRYEKINSTIAKRFINKVGKDKIADLFALFVADRMDMEGFHVFDDIYSLKFECERILTEKQPLKIKDLAVNGHDLMEMGIPQGKKIGVILNNLLEMVLKDFKLNNKETLLEIAETLAYKK